MKPIQLSLFGKMSQGQSLATTVMTFRQFYGKWQKQGVITLNGECWTHNGSESPNAEKESLSLLYGILQPTSQLTNKYLMTSKAAKGFIHRAVKRNKQIPLQLDLALQQVASQEQDMASVDQSTLIDISVFHNHGFSVWKEDTHTAGTLVARDVKGARHFVVARYADEKTIVRRLSEIEYERLMGWDDDHTRFRADGKETPSTQRFKMCGNGVVAPVATWIGERIVGLLRSGDDHETLAQ